MAEAVEEAVLQNLARPLVELGLVARAVEDVAHLFVELPAVHARLDALGGRIERLLDEPIPLLELVGRLPDDVRARHVRVAPRRLVPREEIEDDRLVRCDLAGSLVVADRCLRTMGDDHVAAFDVVIGEDVLDHALQPFAGQRIAVDLEAGTVRLRTPQQLA